MRIWIADLFIFCKFVFVCVCVYEQSNTVQLADSASKLVTLIEFFFLILFYEARSFLHSNRYTNRRTHNHIRNLCITYTTCEYIDKHTVYGVQHYFHILWVFFYINCLTFKLSVKVVNLLFVVYLKLFFFVVVVVGILLFGDWVLLWLVIFELFSVTAAFAASHCATAAGQCRVCVVLFLNCHTAHIYDEYRDKISCAETHMVFFLFTCLLKTKSLNVSEIPKKKQINKKQATREWARETARDRQTENDTILCVCLENNDFFGRL